MFTTIMIIMILFILLFLWFVIQFVLINRPMFEATFNIVVQFPLSSWRHTWQEASFMSIIVGSVLIGAAVVAMGVLLSNIMGRRKRSHLKKETARLQKELQELRTQHEQMVQIQEQEEAKRAQMIAAVQPVGKIAPEPRETVEIREFDDSSSATPEEISKSFEGAVQRTDFFSQPQPISEEKMPEAAATIAEQTVIAEEPVQPTEVFSQPQPADSEEKMPEAASTIAEQAVIAEEPVQPTEVFSQPQPADSEEKMPEEVIPSEENTTTPFSPEVEERLSSEIPGDTARVQEEETTDSPPSSQQKPRKNDE